MKLRYVRITMIKQFEFHYFLYYQYDIKFRDFKLRVPFISRVLNFAILKKSRKSRNLVLAKLSENKVFVIAMKCWLILQSEMNSHEPHTQKDCINTLIWILEWLLFYSFYKNVQFGFIPSNFCSK